MVGVNSDDSVGSWNPIKWVDTIAISMLHLWLAIILAERFGQGVDTHVLICGQEFLSSDHQLYVQTSATEYPVRKCAIENDDVDQWKYAKCLFFIDMHDSKDAQDFQSLTCHIMQAFKKIFHLFFGTFYGGNTITIITMKMLWKVILL